MIGTTEALLSVGNKSRLNVEVDPRKYEQAEQKNKKNKTRITVWGSEVGRGAKQSRSTHVYDKLNKNYYSQIHHFPSHCCRISIRHFPLSRKESEEILLPVSSLPRRNREKV